MVHLHIRFRNIKHFIAAIALVSIIFVSCKSNGDFVKVSNSSPKYADKKYVDLERLYSLDVTRISMFGKESNPDFERVIDFDKNNNIYILDVFESTISTFDEDGKFLKTFGRAGQGPDEFIRPWVLIIRKDQIYVFHGFFEYKIVSLEGEYLSSGRIHIENPLTYKIIDDDFYVFRAQLDRTLTKMEFILLRIEGDDFSKSTEIFKYDYPPGFSGLSYDNIWNWLFISKKGEFYFPEDNLSKYSITKYDKDGQPDLIFSRKYDHKEYSKAAKDRFYALYEKQIQKGDLELPQSPPVVRKMFQDKRKNIWVISGETYEDNLNPDHENTIDIFNEKGEWLYTFKSKYLSRNCLYNDGKIYRVLPVNLETFDQYIEVYTIKY